MNPKPVFHIPQNIFHVCELLQQSGYQAYLVGGAVRDLLRNENKWMDFDVTTSALPEQVTTLFGCKRTIPTGIKHGTVTVLLTSSSPNDPRSVEITTFRKESNYSDGRRPTHIEFLADLKEDLQRRDFTMNAIAYDPIKREIIDPFYGQKDLAEKCIRAVGNPIERFSEDGLRSLRAIRFVSQLGFQIDPETNAAIPKTLDTFKKVSQERIRQELLKLLVGPSVILSMQLLNETGLWDLIFPEIAQHNTLTLQTNIEQILTHLPQDPILRLGAIFMTYQLWLDISTMSNMLSRLTIRNQDQKRIVSILQSKPLDITHTWSAYNIRVFLSTHDRQLVEDLLHITHALVLSNNRGYTEQQFPKWQTLKAMIQIEMANRPPLTISDLALSGNDVMEYLYLPAGKKIGDLLKYLLAEVLKDPSKNTKEYLKMLLDRQEV